MSDSDGAKVFIFFAVGTVMGITAMVTGCTDEAGARKTLESAGFSDITITGWATGICDRDWYWTGFRAKGPTGIVVEGAVCEGLWLKGATIRYGTPINHMGEGK